MPGISRSQTTFALHGLSQQRPVVCAQPLPHGLCSPVRPGPAAAAPGVAALPPAAYAQPLYEPALLFSCARLLRVYVVLPGDAFLLQPYVRLLAGVAFQLQLLPDGVHALSLQPLLSGAQLLLHEPPEPYALLPWPVRVCAPVLQPFAGLLRAFSAPLPGALLLRAAGLPPASALPA